MKISLVFLNIIMRKARQLKLSGFSHDEYFFAFFIYLSATKHAHIRDIGWELNWTTITVVLTYNIV